ncbi:hypothetical protein BH10BDE1_BH10BDE1_00230 [soil metagenome]
MTIEKGQNSLPSSEQNLGAGIKPTIVLMRHAARDFSDDGLSAEGDRQSKQLPEILVARGLTGKILIESSPKRRTRATLRALAEVTGQKILVNTDLDERDPSETHLAFEQRVKDFCDKIVLWAQNLLVAAAPVKVETTRLACSHIDWLEAALQYLPSDETELGRSESWAPMAIRSYQFEDGIWRRHT